MVAPDAINLCCGSVSGTGTDFLELEPEKSEVVKQAVLRCCPLLPYLPENGTYTAPGDAVTYALSPSESTNIEEEALKDAASEQVGSDELVRCAISGVLCPRQDVRVAYLLQPHWRCPELMALLAPEPSSARLVVHYVFKRLLESGQLAVFWDDVKDRLQVSLIDTCLAHHSVQRLASIITGTNFADIQLPDGLRRVDVPFPGCSSPDQIPVMSLPCIISRPCYKPVTLAAGSKLSIQACMFHWRLAKLNGSNIEAQQRLLRV